MMLSVHHGVEMASRLLRPKEIEALARLYGIISGRLVGMFERRAQDNRSALERGVPPEQLLPRTPRSLLKDEAKWGRLGALERCAMRRTSGMSGCRAGNRRCPSTARSRSMRTAGTALSSIAPKWSSALRSTNSCRPGRRRFWYETARSAWACCCGPVYSPMSIRRRRRGSAPRLFCAPRRLRGSRGGRRRRPRPPQVENVQSR
jgi:hypothetical protein